MAIFKTVILSHQKKKDDTYPIKIRVTSNRTTAYISTPFCVTKKELKGKGSTLELKDGVVLDKMHDLVRSLREKTLNIQGIDSMSAKEVVEAINNLEEKNKPWSLDFVDYIKQDEQRLIRNNQDGTASLRATMRRSFSAFVNADSFPIEKITRLLLQQWLEWIPRQAYGKQRKGRAQSLYITQMKAVYNRAKKEFNDEDINLIRIPWNPFKNLEIPKPAQVAKRAITVDQLRKIIALQDEATGRKRLAIDVFLLSFYLIGMNAADLYTCTDYNGKRITYNRKKTASRRQDKAEFSVLVPEEARPIVEKYLDGNEYVFRFRKMYSDVRNFEHAISKGLDYLDNEIGVDGLQFYAARHTWATIAANDAGIDKYTVHTALNHVDKQMAVTDMYIKKDWRPIDEANRKVIDYVLNK